MDIMRPRHNSTDGVGSDDVPVVIVETDEAERLVFEGASEDEVEAKLEDFLTWAS